jgi:hypothetical protein
MVIKFYSDASHGWYAVPVADVRASKADISAYSYTDGRLVYLEEDCDFGRYLKAVGIDYRDVTIQEQPQEDDSFIRNLRSYRG